MQKFSANEILNNEISLYTDEKATINQIKSEVRKLSAAFPDIDNDYVIVLFDRLLANGFTKQRVYDAISYVVDTCHYKRPMIAEIVSFDQKVKIYTHAEMCAKCYPGHASDDFFKMIELNGEKRWVEK